MSICLFVIEIINVSGLYALTMFQTWNTKVNVELLFFTNKMRAV